MFVNISNQMSHKWSGAQCDAAVALANGGEICDLLFPCVSPDASDADVMDTAQRTVKVALEIIEARNSRIEEKDVFHVMGEITCTFHIVNALKNLGYKVFASTYRRTKETRLYDDGSEVYTELYKFVKFREY